jgi:hypothetical protein
MRFETEEAAALVIDFMPSHGEPPDLIRIVVGERGTMQLRTELIVRCGYGATVPWCSKLDSNTLVAVSGPDMVVLRSPVQLRGEDLKSPAQFSVSAVLQFDNFAAQARAKQGLAKPPTSTSSGSPTSVEDPDRTAGSN